MRYRPIFATIRTMRPHRYSTRARRKTMVDVWLCLRLQRSGIIGALVVFALCLALPTSANADTDTCRWARDGVCDDPSYLTCDNCACEIGTDGTDCGGNMFGARDSCRWARDGECDEPGLCAVGTDTTDCRTGATSGSACWSAEQRNGVWGYYCYPTGLFVPQSFLPYRFGERDIANACACPD